MLSRLHSIFFKNWIPKLTCLLIAVGLWFWVAIQQTGRSEFEVPVEFQNKPDDLYVTDQSTRNVTVTLQGPKTSLFRTSSSEITAILNLRGQEAGTRTFWSSELTIQQPQGLQVYDVSPQNIRVDLVHRSEKRIPVDPQLNGSLPQGYNYRTSVEPSTATVVGPVDTLEDFNELELSSVTLNNRETGTETLDLEAMVPAGLKITAPETNSFQVTLEVYRETLNRTIEDIPVNVENVPAGMRAIVEPSQVDLEVVGPEPTVRNLQPEDIDVSVPAPQKGSGLKIRVADVSLPEGVEVVDGNGSISAIKVKLESR